MVVAAIIRVLSIDLRVLGAVCSTISVIYCSLGGGGAKGAAGGVIYMIADFIQVTAASYDLVTVSAGIGGTGGSAGASNNLGNGGSGGNGNAGTTGKIFIDYRSLSGSVLSLTLTSSSNR